jgi:hypothetical protein
MKKTTRTRSFDQLSDAEKEAIYQECERVQPDDGVPLNAKDRARHRRAGLPVGRPRIGKGAKRINISMEKDLLKSADAFAQKRKITRARLIAESVKAYLRGAA